MKNFLCGSFELINLFSRLFLSLDRLLNGRGYRRFTFKLSWKDSHLVSQVEEHQTNLYQNSQEQSFAEQI